MAPIEMHKTITLCIDIYINPLQADNFKLQCTQRPGCSDLELTKQSTYAYLSNLAHFISAHVATEISNKISVALYTENQ